MLIMRKADNISSTGLPAIFYGGRLPPMAKRKKQRHRATHIKAWRKFRGLSQARLADRLGVTQSALSQLETGETAYVQPTLEAIADALQCAPADLIMRPPGAVDEIRDVLRDLGAEGQKRALAVIKALKDSEAA